MQKTGHKDKKRKKKKLRNWIAFAAIFKPGIKILPDKKKKDSKEKCRKKIKDEE